MSVIFNVMSTIIYLQFVFMILRQSRYLPYIQQVQQKSLIEPYGSHAEPLAAFPLCVFDVW